MISRRGFLKTGGLLAIGHVLGQSRSKGLAFASSPVERSSEKVLDLCNIHTGERLTTRYCVEGCYLQDEIDRISHLLRCHYTNTVKPIDVRVIDLLCGIKDQFGFDKEAEIISGYRSPEYNEYLRRLGRQVAAGSLHLAGMAIDFAFPGVATKDLSRTAMRFAAGGVGLYPDFVHIDVGRIRRW